MNLHQDRYFTLPAGQRLGYAEYGASTGTPVLFFHGSPGSSYIHADMADIAAQCGIRLIAVDRPGYGLSSPQPGRTMLDWPDDVAALADALGLERFAIIGFSGGSPYALACAYKLPNRLTTIALVGALAPTEAPGVMEGMSPAVSGLYVLAQSNPDELRKIFAAVAPSPAALVATMSGSAGECDKNVISARHSEFETEYTKTLRSGIEGIASDFVLASNNWGFPLKGITTETHLWCGKGDCNTPLAMTNYVSSQLANSRTFILPDVGHFALYGHWAEILERLI